MDMQLFILLGSIAVALPLIMRRMSRGHYGKIQPSREVAEAYEGYRWKAISLITAVVPTFIPSP